MFEFYLINSSFQFQQIISLVSLRSKIESLASDCAFIRENREIIYRNNDIYDITLYDGLTIKEIIWSDNRVLTRDQQVSLQVIIDHSKKTAITEVELQELINLNDETNIHALLALNDVQGFDSNYVIHDRNDWYNFHRYSISKHPVSERHFLNGIKKYFPELVFHEQIESTLRACEGDFKNFAFTITSSLKNLQEEFPKYLVRSDLPGTLQRFSSACSLNCTLEGNVNHKPALTFSFLDRDMTLQDVCCEPHIKLERSDRHGDHTYYYNRIYFHIGKPEIAEGRILIGYIGKHIEF